MSEATKYRLKLVGWWLIGPVAVPVVLFLEYLKEVWAMWKDLYAFTDAVAAFKNGGPVTRPMPDELRAFLDQMEAAQEERAKQFAGIKDVDSKEVH